MGSIGVYTKDGMEKISFLSDEMNRSVEIKTFVPKHWDGDFLEVKIPLLIPCVRGSVLSD